ncbi:MAG: hypothetical protein JNK72_09630 [Myxococcales bacterium]|nr:hypothetical protein [Myxococcales bacterium]
MTDTPEGEVFDGGGEAGADDAAPGDAGEADGPTGDGGRRCGLDNDCREPGVPYCDLATGRCVACRVDGADCQRGQRCDPASGACVEGCSRQEDCTRGEADAGGPPLRCDLNRGVCVACMSDDECPLRTICAEGRCVTGCNERRGCAVGEVCCSNSCVETATELAHCGGCGMRCEGANAVTSCTNGACAIDRCNEGFANCDAQRENGCEADLRSSPAHCGRCGNACPRVPNAEQIACTGGRCGFSCASGYADCDGNGTNGCERNLDGDAAHCGRCGNVCPLRPGASAVNCTRGVCGVVCNAGLGDCDGDLTNGCETNVRSSLLHCGACGNACPSGPNSEATCTLGRCGLSCAAGFGNCDGDASNGCETDLRTSTAHCGACARSCAVMGGTAACVASACTVAACGSDFADCDRTVSNGCEADLRANPQHCGACGTVCPSRPNAAGQCVNRQCAVLCNPGFVECDGNPSNGCEVDTRTSVAHCGGCGRVCTVANGTPSCVGGACAVGSCQPGRGNCDNNVANGCEADLVTDTNNCGACGRRGVEVCDGLDNDCDAQIDEGCPTGLEGLDVYDFSAALYGTGVVSYDIACPAGTVVTGYNGRTTTLSTRYPTGLQLRCGRPRIFENRATVPFTYQVVLDDAGTSAFAGASSGLTFNLACPANAFVNVVSGRYSSYALQLGFACAQWSLAGSPSLGWTLVRTAVGSAQAFGLASGTSFTHTTPLEGNNGSALRSLTGRHATYFYSMTARATAPSVVSRP